MTIFLRIIEPSAEAKPAALFDAVAKIRSGQLNDLAGKAFDCSPHAFASFPGSPFGYWVSDSFRSIFRKYPALETDSRSAVSGGKTLDDFRWIRASWEIGNGRSGDWVGYAKGGAFSPFYADVHLLLDWRGDARALKAYLVTYRSSRGWSPNWTAELHGSEDYLRAGLTWPRRTDGLSFRVMPAGCVFGDKGPAVFVDGDTGAELFALCAVMNSRVFGYLVSIQLARTELAQSYEVGLIQRTPVPKLSGEVANALGQFARRAWSLTRKLDSCTETSHAFLLPRGLSGNLLPGESLDIEREIEFLQTQMDEAVFRLYGVAADDRAAIEASSASRRVLLSALSDEKEESDDTEDCLPEGTSTTSSGAIESWLVGAAFSRFDPRLATGERAIPPEPEPFDPLPARSPGMYPEGEEPADRPDILVDDEGHADDLTARAAAIAEQVNVDVRGNLRGWLAKEFFPLHIKMYSKSRRKAPIYWQLATPSATYSVWLYIHAFSKDTLFRVQNDYVAPKLAHEERRLESLTSELHGGATSAQRRQLAAQNALVDELRAFLDEVKRVAPLWKPNLDDGVIINFAPLWRLVPQNKSWQKELKSTWDALCGGTDDWAHLAMHLWPERVVPKCAKDRSLAIAHGLEDVFWAESSDGKWIARKAPSTSVDELLKERTSPAVKSALASLLEASVPSGKSTARKGGGHRNGNFAAAPEDLPAFAESAWARPHIMERGEIQAAILAVLKANGAPMARDEARLAALLCLEPHLLIPQLDATDKKTWLRFVGADGKKTITASIGNTIQEWGSALSGLRGRGRLDESLRQNTWAIGTGADAIDTRGWPEGRAGFVIDVLRRRQAVTQLETIILKLPPPVQQWFLNAA